MTRNFRMQSQQVEGQVDGRRGRGRPWSNLVADTRSWISSEPWFSPKTDNDGRSFHAILETRKLLFFHSLDQIKRNKFSHKDNHAFFSKVSWNMIGIMGNSDSQRLLSTKAGIPYRSNTMMMIDEFLFTEVTSTIKELMEIKDSGNKSYLTTPLTMQFALSYCSRK